jgi:PncC family amidohydrolase
VTAQQPDPRQQGEHDEGTVTMERAVPFEDEGGPHGQTIAATLQAELFTRGQMIATAESLTGGELGVLLSAAPGASDTYKGGVIAYDTSVKTGVLGVEQEIVDRFGVVSAECAEAMARGVRVLLGTDLGVSTTGVAGPTAQEGKPVGRVFVGVAGPQGVRSVRLELDGERADIRARACLEAMTAAIQEVRAREVSGEE